LRENKTVKAMSKLTKSTAITQLSLTPWKSIRMARMLPRAMISKKAVKATGFSLTFALPGASRLAAMFKRLLLLNMMFSLMFVYCWSGDGVPFVPLPILLPED
jgi:hypothetical protein